MVKVLKKDVTISFYKFGKDNEKDVLDDSDNMVEQIKEVLSELVNDNKIVVEVDDKSTEEMNVHEAREE